MRSAMPAMYSTTSRGSGSRVTGRARNAANLPRPTPSHKGAVAMLNRSPDRTSFPYRCGLLVLMSIAFVTARPLSAAEPAGGGGI